MMRSYVVGCGMAESLEGLAYRNGMQVRPDPDFTHDMQRLIADVDRLLAREPDSETGG